jgi:hypothetical protein
VKWLGILRRVFLALGVLMLLGAGWSWQHTTAFMAVASRAEGRVIALDESRGSSTGSGGRSSSYAPVVSYRTAAGVDVVYTEKTHTNPPTHAVGETVQVLYRAEDPESARLDTWASLWFMTFIFGLLGAIFVLIGAGLFVVPAWLARRDAEIIASGVRVIAKFERVELNTSVRINNASPWRIVASWQDPGGTRHELRSKNLWDDPTELIKSDQIGAWVDPKDPKRHVLDVAFLTRSTP